MSNVVTPSSTNAASVPAPAPAEEKKALLSFSSEDGGFVMTLRIRGKVIKLGISSDHRDDLVNQLTGVSQGAVRGFDLEPVDVIQAE